MWGSIASGVFGMLSEPERHFRRTRLLARAIKPREVFRWLMTEGYYPETYVLPPSFHVQAYPASWKYQWSPKGKKYQPKIAEPLEVHFPKTDLTDRVFGLIDPQIHREIALTIAQNWASVLRAIFHASNCVYSYSFPIPLDARHRGSLGRLRAGRMIYEFIEMAERGLAAEAFRYACLIKTDIKNFYPSIYTHSIAWALHGKSRIRKRDRYNMQLFGNRLDKLFQNASDGCTNGIPIGPAVSDLVSEVVLSGVDRELSKRIRAERLDVLVVRFKDDYRVLAASPEVGRSTVKSLQAAAKEYRLELHDEKTETDRLPEGVFRPWVSEYHALNPSPRKVYDARRFVQVYLGVLGIDRRNPGSGVIDRFLADIAGRGGQLRLKAGVAAARRVFSLLLMIACLRPKAFPKALAILEGMLSSRQGRTRRQEVAEHLADMVEKLHGRERESVYLLTWLCYFLRANGLETAFRRRYKFKSAIVRAVYTSRFTHFAGCKGFVLFQGVKSAARRVSLLRHLDVFARR